MRNASSWALLASVCVGALLGASPGARAADLSTAGPLRGSIDIPPPPPIAPTVYEVGLRYWYSTGETGWNHDASSASALYGNPTSKLTYRDLSGHSGELFGRAHHYPTGLFAKGLVGVGGVVDGVLQDQDWFAGGVEFSDTSSTVDGDGFLYAMADVGWSPIQTERLRLGGFVGYHYWNERLDAFGAHCNPDDVGGFYCPTGADVIPSDIIAISNEVEYHAVRVGVDGRLQVVDGLSVSGEVAYVPYAALNNEDSHYHRDDLGPVPNVHHEGESSGVEAEVLLTYQATEFLALGAGFRYWGLWGDGEIRSGSRAGTPLPVNDFDSERYGLLLQAGYVF